MSWYSDRIDEIARPVTNKVTMIKPVVTEMLGGMLDPTVSLELDAAVRVILDDSFFRAIAQARLALDAAIDKLSQTFRDLAQQIFDSLMKLAQRVEQIIDRFFQHVTEAIQNIKKYLLDPFLAALRELEAKFFQDLNAVLDKIFDFFAGTIQDIKDEIVKAFFIIDPYDSCRKEFGLGITLPYNLTPSDVFNLFECRQLKRIGQASAPVSQIKEIYANLELRSFRMTCAGRGAPDFQEIYFKRWLRYQHRYSIWKEYSDTMTAEEAYSEAVRKLQDARNEYLQKVADIQRAQATADKAFKLADGVGKSVKPFVNSKTLKEFIAKVQYKVRHDGYQFFIFPNVSSWDIYANGQFYSGHDFIKNSPLTL